MRRQSCQIEQVDARCQSWGHWAGQLPRRAPMKSGAPLRNVAAAIRLLPAGCTSCRASRPSPVPTATRSSVSTTRPGAARPEMTLLFHSLKFCPFQVVKAAGHGEKARIMRSTRRAGSVQSMWPSCFFDQRADGGLAGKVFLCDGGGVPVQPAGNRLAEQTGAESCQPMAEGVGGVASEDRQGSLGEYRPGIHAGVHEHDGYACFGQSIQKRCGYGGCAPVGGKETCMHIETAVGRDV